MHDFSLTHLSDDSLLRDLTLLVIKERRDTAWILAHIAEVDARKLYVPAGYSSMHVYCVEKLHFSDEAAYRRITVARAAREFPMIFVAVADGRLHLTAVSLLAPHLTPENAEQLLSAATHLRNDEIRDMLARLIPARQPESSLLFSQLGPDRVGHQATSTEVDQKEDALGPTESPAPASLVQFEPSRPAPTPPPVEHLVQLAVRPSTRDKLRYAQALLSHALPSGDVSQVLERALDLLITKIQNRKIGAGKVRTDRRPLNVGGRYIRSEVRNAVWKRDKGQCTFVSADGKRCTARRLLEFDHVTPVARGGNSTVEGVRLRCRAHNQFEAERVFGVNFMRKKRRRP